LIRSLFCVAAVAACASAHADTFGSGENAFEIAFVTIGQPGNPADTTGDPNPAGSVGYEYRIGKFEVPEEAVRKANAASALAGAPLGITLDSRGPQKPATSRSWFEAARFVNWLNAEKGASPAYKFDAAGNFQLWTSADPGFNPSNPFRNQQALYFLPSIDEWYKAAFFDPVAGVYWDYPTGSNEAPIAVASGTAPGTAVWNQTTGPADVQLAGGMSPFGTVGQGGNVNEWEETSTDLFNDNPADFRGIRGGTAGLASSALGLSSSFRSTIFPPTGEPVNVGLRVVSVPEPSAAAILMFVAVATRRASLRRRVS
jgi:formylglycine-generating enzyme required for sulfatase activity